jgi:hypothetical protein
MTRQSNKFYAGRGGNSSISAARGNSSQLGLLPWTPKNRQWRSPVPQSEGNFFPKCDRIPERSSLRVGGSGRSSGECRFSKLSP